MGLKERGDGRSAKAEAILVGRGAGLGTVCSDVDWHQLPFRGIGNSKATGLGAVLGGLAESFVMWGIGAMLIGQVTAIVLLTRAFSREHWMRSLFSVLSFALSGLMLVLVGLFLCGIWYESHHGYIGAH